jgi:Uma2 family endonuclease
MTTTVSQTQLQITIPATVGQRRFTVTEYERMGEVGILGADERTELIEGVIIQMSPIGRLHARCVDDLTLLMINTLGTSAIVRIQGPIQLNDYSEPEPDVSLLRPRPDRYAQSLPTPDEILALIEVADTTYDSDRYFKLPIYAQNGIPEVWIVNLNQDQVERYADPANSTYQTVQIAQRGDSLIITALPGLAFPVDQILP